MFMSARSVFVALVCVSLAVLWSGRDSAVESADYAAAQGSLSRHTGRRQIRSLRGNAGGGIRSQSARVRDARKRRADSDSRD